MKDLLVISASARKQSDTLNFVQKVLSGLDYSLIDLLDFPVSPYSYSGNYAEEDKFFNIIEEVLQHKAIVFATPVYWYAMSGLMKNFFDRFTDLITTHKSNGRQLKGKVIFVLAVGADKELPEGFEVPFHRTTKYFSMSYGGCLYHSIKHPEQNSQIQCEFLEKLKKHL